MANSELYTFCNDAGNKYPIVPLYMSIPIGFIFFTIVFWIVYKYGKKSKDGIMLHRIMTFIWALYGISALLIYLTYFPRISSVYLYFGWSSKNKNNIFSGRLI